MLLLGKSSKLLKMSNMRYKGRSGLSSLAMYIFVLANTQFILAENIRENIDVTKQIQGDYGQMERVASLPLGSIQRIWDKSKDGEGIYEVDYNPHKVVKIRIREHMTSTISLPKWEKIERIIVADEGVVKGTRHKNNIIILEPQHFVGTDTSVTIIGRGHTYLLYVRLEGYNSKTIPDVGVNIRAYPPHGFSVPDGKDSISMMPKDYLEQALTKPEELNFNFSMAGSKDIAPKMVYSDGVRTWLYYGDNIRKKRLPSIYAVVDGVDTPVNSTRIKNALVVQGSGIFTLRNGGKITCLYPTKLRNGKQ